MVTILLTEHGSFASGMLSAAKLIVGAHPQLFGVDFVEGENTDDLSAHLLSVIEASPDATLILTDIAGGSPYNISVTLRSQLTERDIEVVSGCNVPMLISAVLERGEDSPTQVADSVIETAQKAIKRFKKAKPLQTLVTDGI